MKFWIPSAWLVMAILSCGVFDAPAAGFTNLYNFQDTTAYAPRGIVPVGDSLYGIAMSGGTGGYGTIFRVNLDGSGYTNLHNFTGANNDGASPRGTLIVSSNILYGTTFYGGMFGVYGTVFRLNLDGSGFTNLHMFNYTDGENPAAGLVLCGNTLYGTTTAGNYATALRGTVFAVNTDGSGFTTLHAFSLEDGYQANAALVVRSNILYGSTVAGGASGSGTLFKVNTDGSGFTNFYMPDGVTSASPYWPFTFVGDVLYGVMGNGEPNGIVFKINPDGTGFTTVFQFNGANGSVPMGPLLLKGSTLYGSTLTGGTANDGTVFRVNADGSGFLTLHSFGGNDGYSPYAGLVLSSNILYGTTSQGSNGRGTIYDVGPPPPNPIALGMGWAGNAAVLTWSDPAFSLQSSPSVTGNYTNISGAMSPYTNSSVNARMFFRLQAN